MKRIYLDNAATSWPKPTAVYEAVDHYQRQLGAPAGRGTYREAAEAERLVAAARRNVARLIGADHPQRVVFTFNGTDSLNLALHGLLREGDHAITTAAEHNSVLRPLRFLEAHRGVQVTRVPCSPTGLVDPDDIRRAVRPTTRLVAVIHASNVTGTVQPVEAIGLVARQHGAVFLVDAAQSVGHVPIDVDQLHADLLAAPGHKSLFGPLGTGFLFVRSGLENQLLPLRQGGTGTHSEQDRQPDEMPARYESGNHNVPGLAGLAAGTQFVLDEGVERLRRQGQSQTQRLLDGLADCAKIRVYGSLTTADRIGVVSCNIEGLDPQEVAGMLDQAHRVQVRSGFHCAPLIHEALGTRNRGGAIRISLGAMNTDDEIDLAVEALREIAAQAAEV